MVIFKNMSTKTLNVHRNVLSQQNVLIGHPASSCLIGGGVTVSIIGHIKLMGKYEI